MSKPLKEKEWKVEDENIVILSPYFQLNKYKVIQERRGKGRRSGKPVISKYFSKVTQKAQNYVRRCIYKKIPLGITTQDMICLFLKKCFYCDLQGTMMAPIGIDRLDSERGYVVGNVVSCCSTCNYMKNTLGLVEFLRQVNRIASHCIDDSPSPSTISSLIM